MQVRIVQGRDTSIVQRRDGRNEQVRNTPCDRTGYSSELMRVGVLDLTETHALHRMETGANHRTASHSNALFQALVTAPRQVHNSLQVDGLGSSAHIGSNQS